MTQIGDDSVLHALVQAEKHLDYSGEMFAVYVHQIAIDRKLRTS